MCENRGVRTRKFGMGADGRDVDFLFLFIIYTFHIKINFIGILFFNLSSCLHALLTVRLQYLNFPLLENGWRVLRCGPQFLLHIPSLLSNLPNTLSCKGEAMDVSTTMIYNHENIAQVNI